MSRALILAVFLFFVGLFTFADYADQQKRHAKQLRVQIHEHARMVEYCLETHSVAECNQLK